MEASHGGVRQREPRARTKDLLTSRRRDPCQPPRPCSSGIGPVAHGWEQVAKTQEHAASTSRDGEAADKIVYSKTLETVSTAKTRIERDFDPEAVRQMKALAGRDLIVGGPELAAQAFKAGLVEECHLFVAPMVVGGGKRSLPKDVRLKLELLDERSFASVMVYLHYRIRRTR